MASGTASGSRGRKTIPAAVILGGRLYECRSMLLGAIFVAALSVIGCE
jgi:hypothetical protein